MKTHLRLSLSALLLAALAGGAAAADYSAKLKIEAGDHARRNAPARTLVAVPASLAEVPVAELKTADGETITAQLNAPRLLADELVVKDGFVARELTFVINQLGKGQSRTYAVAINSGDEAEGETYAWRDAPGKYIELSYGDRPALRYMCEPLDESSPSARERTYKVFHHVYNPAGTAIVTKGPGGLYTHHRGLFYGFMKCTYGDNQHADTWHCRDGVYQSHEGVLSEATGPIFGRHLVAVDWHGKDKAVFAHEQREMTVYHLPGGALIEFASRLKSADGPLKVDGDPQHAGFQFRASNEVAAKTKGQTYYLRTDGKGKPGETRNWPGDKRQVNLPWNAMSFVVGGQRYTAAYLDHPDNPKEARYSERDYGRFGSYFVHKIPEGETLDVNYRLWLQNGEMTVAGVEALRADFADPPRVTVLP